MKRKIIQLSILSSCFFLISCAGPNKKDPYESYNRTMFKFNEKAYDYVFTPIADTYVKVVPVVARTSITNFFKNLKSPVIILNDTLQGNFQYAFEDTSRFILNTIFGFFGLVDVAADINLYQRSQGFGYTLAVWGYDNSNYLVLPLLGPSSIRGTIGFAVDMYTNPLTYYLDEENLGSLLYYTQLSLKIINITSIMIPRQKSITEYAIDPYVAVRNGYVQYTNMQIKKLKN